MTVWYCCQHHVLFSRLTAFQKGLCRMAGLRCFTCPSRIRKEVSEVTDE